MKTTIEIKGQKISYDINSLVKEAENISFDEISNQEEGETGYEYNTDEIDFLKQKNDFISAIKNLDNTIVELFSNGNNVVFTKANKLHKGRNHKLINSIMCLNYYNEYGSHSYDVPYIILCITSDNTCSLVLSNISEQDSF